MYLFLLLKTYKNKVPYIVIKYFNIKYSYEYRVLNATEYNAILSFKYLSFTSFNFFQN